MATTEHQPPRTSTDTASPRPSIEDVSTSQNSAFQAAISAWRNIDLTQLQKTLDAAANDIVSAQRESLVERKELAQKTKDYRKLDDEQKKEDWKGLLKSYQGFIDHLTTSKKATETSFLSLYSTLSEAPDPYPLLEATIDSLVNFSEMQATTKDNGSLKATVSRLSSQITNLEASLAAKNKELDRREKEQKDESQRIEEVWRGVLDEKSRNWEGKEKALSEKLEHQETVLKEIKASYEVAQRMGPTSPGAEDDLLGKERAAELEIVTRDLERTTLRLTEVEGRNEQLRLELERASTGQVAPTKTQAESEEDDTTILRLQHENADLLRKVRNAKSDLDAATKDSERKIRSLERLIAGVENDKEALKEKVSSWSDYADVKRELEILKSIEFSTGDDDDDDDDSEIDTHLDLLATSKKESLEQLLLARNKKLGNELTVLRVSHQDLSQRLSTLQHSLDTATADLAASKSLNARLEDDLLKLQQQQYQPSQYTPGPAPSIAGTYASRYPSARPRISPTSSIIGGSSPGTLDSLRTLNDASPNAGILPMITAQRDRFKQRNAALEESLSTAHTTISTLRDEVASLQKDNLALYEKTRYVSSYTPSTTTMTSGFAPPATSIDRYRQAYEANISPFEAFRGRESARAYHRLGVPERLIYSLTRVILANRVSRNVFAAYCVALHGLVLCMLYWAGTGTGGVGKWEQVGFDERL